MYYWDDFSKEFRDEVELHEYLEEVDERAQWLRVPSNKLEVLTVKGNESVCTPVVGVQAEEILKDTVNHTGLLLKAAGRVYQLGNTAIKSLLGRARISGSALAEIGKEPLADILNECLRVAKGKALIRCFEGKVRAVLSGDEKDYSILSMPQIFMVASAYINGDFQNVEFQSGYTDHYSTCAAWNVADRSEEHTSELQSH